MKRINPDKSRDVELDEMLRLLKAAPIPEPSAEIRQNLQRVVAASRVPETPKSPPAPHVYWARWAFPSVACLAALVTVGLHYTHRPSKGVTPTVSPVGVLHVDPAHDFGRELRNPVAPPRKIAVGNRKHFRGPALRDTSPQPRTFTVELPYSNRDIANGTDTTVRVGVSREELTALGFPLGDVTGNGKYLAEVALGDDGLPRSIRIPLPLRSLD